MSALFTIVLISLQQNKGLCVEKIRTFIFPGDTFVVATYFIIYNTFNTIQFQIFTLFNNQSGKRRFKGYIRKVSTARYISIFLEADDTN